MECYHMNMKEYITEGQVIDRLTVVKHLYSDKWDKYWVTVCGCGSERVRTTKYLTRKTTIDKSCGCAQSEWLSTRNKSNKTHGMSHTREFKIWTGMKTRCLNKNHIYYHSYGGRGIKVCDRWLDSFKNFYEDMGRAPEGKTLDRIDNNGNYSPENCRWITRARQASNRRNSRLYVFEGEQLTANDIARRIGVNINTFESWLYHHNYDIKEAIERFMK